MRVVFCGQSGPYSPEALRVLLGSGVPVQWLAVVECRKRLMGRLRHRWLHPHGRGMPHSLGTSGDSLGDVALGAGLPVLQSCDVNASWPVDQLARLEPDWLVCVGFDRLFSSGFLKVARVGGMNAHPSDLPLLRGPAPIFWALRGGCTESMLTVHLLDEKEDHGPILMRKPFVFRPRATGSELYTDAARLAGNMVATQLGYALTGHLTTVPQVHERATRAPRPRAEDVHVEPSLWYCEHLVRFACGAVYFKTPWLRLGGKTFFVCRGLAADVGGMLGGGVLFAR